MHSLEPRTGPNSRPNHQPPKPGPSLVLTIGAWLIAGPVFAIGALTALIIPTLAPVLVVAAVTVGMAVTAVQVTRHLDQPTDQARTHGVEMVLTYRRLVRPEGGDGAAQLDGAANLPLPHPQQHTSHPSERPPALGNTRATLRPVSENPWGRQ